MAGDKLKEILWLSQIVGDTMLKIVEANSKYRVLQDNKKIGEYNSMDKAVSLVNKKAEQINGIIDST